MARYFFDTYDDHRTHVDVDGTEFGALAEVRREVQRFLPEMAGAELPDDGDRCAFVVVVRDEAQRTIYSATLTYTGLWHLG